MSLKDRFSFIREIWSRFREDNGFLLAAALSFYMFLSLFPLLLLAVGVLGFVLGSPEHAEEILTRQLGAFVIGPGTMAIVRDTIHGRDAAAGIGLILLLWSGTTALVVLEQAMNLAWNATERRSYIKRRAVALLTLLIVALMLAISLGITALIHTVEISHEPLLTRLSVVWRLLAYPIPALLSVALFTVMYKLLPYARVTWRTALVGGVFAGALWEIAKHAFTLYVVHFAAYNRVYGSLASVILMMVWIDYSATITVLGAEFASVWSERRRLNRE